MKITVIDQEAELKKHFPIVYTWEDEPGIVYEEHVHQGKVAFYIIDGSINMQFPDKAVELKTGDFFEVPVGVKHSALIGNEGCVFLVGQELKDDA